MKSEGCPCEIGGGSYHEQNQGGTFQRNHVGCRRQRSDLGGYEGAGRGETGSLERGKEASKLAFEWVGMPPVDRGLAYINKYLAS